MLKKALVVGINYVGTAHELKGCVNDANNMRDMLVSKGFDVTMLIEASATTAAMKQAMINLAAGASRGDVLVFHYSGHGSQLPSITEADGYEEIICPYDLDWKQNVITDDFMKSVFNTVPNGANVTVILDCCNSGDSLDTAVPSDLTPVVPVGAVSVVSDNSTTVVTANNGIVTTVVTNKFLPPPAVISEIVAGQSPVVWSASKDVNATAILVAACHSNQTSADAFINGTYQGAATRSILDAVAQKGDLSYTELIASMQLYMRTNGFTQVPELDGADYLKTDVFLDPWANWVEPVTNGTVSVPVVMPNVVNNKSNNTTLYMMVGFIIIFILIVLFA